ncbi:MAG: N-acetylmuramoyl-L-alanine amidase [Endomicrobiaceae bacterium]
MKKTILFLFLIISTCFVTCFASGKKISHTKMESQNLNVVFDGKSMEGLHLYKNYDADFLSLKEIADLFDARLDWQSVSGKVSMKLKNTSVDVFVNSKKTVFGKEKGKLNTPTLKIKNEVFVPVELVLSKKFSELLECAVAFDSKNKILTISSKSNISAVRYYTKENNTEIVIELDENLTYTIKKGKKSIIVSFQRGKITKDSVVANNGAIKDIEYETIGREAVFKINLSQKPKFVKSKKNRMPLQLVIDIEHSSPVDMSKPCEILLPDTLAKENESLTIAKGEKQTSSSFQKDDKDSPAEPPVVDERIISNDSEIYDKPVPAEEDNDSEALAKVKVVSVAENEIIDDSYALIDDTSTFKDIAAPEEEKVQNAKIIVLDAGHGGHDTGAVGPNGTKEKDLNLQIVLLLKKIFDKDKNYKVILTRDDDTFIPLVERTNIANKQKADLFVSVHCNANFKRSVEGFEIYFLSEKASDTDAISTEILENSVLALEDKSDKQKSVLQKMLWSMVVNEYINESSELCSFIICETSGRLKIPTRGIKQANFCVLRGSQMPAVLVECAYLSNYSEEAKLQTKGFQSSIADSIYEGVKKYYARKTKQNCKK